eukprot:scaffold776_cov347-Pavlova_lutheri.AAC.52
MVAHQVLKYPFLRGLLGSNAVGLRGSPNIEAICHPGTFSCQAHTCIGFSSIRVDTKASRQPQLGRDQVYERSRGRGRDCAPGVLHFLRLAFPCVSDRVLVPSSCPKRPSLCHLCGHVRGTWSTVVNRIRRNGRREPSLSFRPCGRGCCPLGPPSLHLSAVLLRRGGDRAMDGRLRRMEGSRRRRRAVTIRRIECDGMDGGKG